ncbi:MAG: NAD-dependent epimerase/dehydratase family protein [Anaerolineales bacterium]
MKAFVTGGSGFIGRHLIRKLVTRGYHVKALSRSPNSDILLQQLGAEPVRGHINDLPALRSGMKGCNTVFHLAAWYHLGKRGAAQAERINVRGTHNVLHTAHQAGVSKIIYTSTIAVFGDTHGQMVDETYYHGAPFLSEYDRTKWLAHYRVAQPLIEAGAPIIIVMPGGVYGPGDTSVIGETLMLFLQGKLPILPGPETTLTYAHVDDIAEGHLLAAEKGKIGQRYILAGEARSMDEIFRMWSNLSGQQMPRLAIPAGLLRPIAPLMGLLETFAPLPAAFSEEALRSLGATYIARSDKARAELGWQPRPLHEGMAETVASALRNLPPAAPTEGQYRQRTAALLLLAALGTLLWILNRDNE